LHTPEPTRTSSKQSKLSGKLTARVKDKAGFVLNRLQYVLLKEAINLVEEGVATVEDVDTIVRTTFGYRLPSGVTALFHCRSERF
jgi:3-hydroxyacyl-CoA dehydrogenase